MEIAHYLDPVEPVWDSIPGISIEESLGSQVRFFDGSENWFNLERQEVVIIGAGEDRNGFDNRFCAKSPAAIRKILYGLRGWSHEFRVIDAGNVRGNSINDRYQALKDVTSWFHERNILVVVIGGTQDLTWPLFQALAKGNDPLHVVVGDAMVDLDVMNQDFSSRAWINKILEEGCLNDFTVLGIQNYLISPTQELFFEEHHLALIRLGEIRGADIKKTEVPLRDSHLVSLDMRMITGQCQFKDGLASPHGVEHHDACQIARYAGMSDQIKVFGLFELGCEGLTGMLNVVLGSQMVWHFLDGYLGRYKDFPVRNLDEYKYYVVHLEEFEEGLRFYQNPSNGRWWMEVPSEPETIVVACEYDDYQKALRNEIPEKWWRFFLKSRGPKLETKK